MSQKITVTLILADRVKNELAILDRAEAQRNPKAVANAKGQIKNVRVLPDSTMDVSPKVLDIYRKFLRDVGDNTFVVTEETMKQAIDAIPATGVE